jgi:Flp pilus assembly protein CpaB
MAVTARREARPARLDLRLVLGLGIALVAFLVGVQVYSSGQPETMAVLVASRDLPQGTVLSEGDLRVEKAPVSEQLSRVLLSESARSQVVGKVTARAIAAGEPILTSALAQGLPLEPQEVALALPVVDRVYVPHQVQAGDRGLLYAIGAGQGGAQQAVLVSDRVRVLAVVRSRQQAGTGPEVAGPPASVTVAVPREEAELVSRAIAQNIVALAVLPAGAAPATPAPRAGQGAPLPAPGPTGTPAPSSPAGGR